MTISTNDLASPFIHGITCADCGIVIEGKIHRTPANVPLCAGCAEVEHHLPFCECQDCAGEA